MSASWPAGLAVVAHPPRLAEHLTAEDFLFVWETLLDEASGVTHVLGLFSSGCLPLPCMDFLLSGSWLWLSWPLLRWLHHLALVLADEFLGCLASLANLKEWVLGVHSVLLTILAEVGIGADGAHVADTNDGASIAAVADNLLMAGLLLLLVLVLQIVDEHLAEAVVAVLLDFLTNDGGDSGELLADESACAVALAAWEALLVHLSAIALDARDFLEVFGVVLVGGHQEVAGDVGLLHQNFHLTGLVLHVGDDTIAAHVTHLHIGLAGVVCRCHTRVYHNVARIDTGGVAADVILVIDFLNTGTDRDSFAHDCI